MSANQPARRVSIADHERFRESMQPTPPPEDDSDMLVIENPPARRPKREADRVLRILDELKSNREGITE